jgi:hypothetical protein
MDCQIVNVKKNHSPNDQDLLAFVSVRVNFGKDEWLEFEVKLLARDKGPKWGRGTPFIVSHVKSPDFIFRQIRDTVLALLEERPDLNPNIVSNRKVGLTHQGEGNGINDSTKN